MRHALVTSVIWGLVFAGLDTAYVKTRQHPCTSGATLPGEAMYPRASKQIWDDVQGIVAQLGFRTEKNDKKRQVLVTSWKSYDERVFPNAAALKLSATDQPLRLQLHVGVAPNREPARVVVGFDRGGRTARSWSRKEVSPLPTACCGRLAIRIARRPCGRRARADGGKLGSSEEPGDETDAGRPRRSVSVDLACSREGDHHASCQESARFNQSFQPKDQVPTGAQCR